MRRLLILAGLSLPLVPAPSLAGDLHRVLSEAHVELLAATEQPAALRGTASTELIEKLEVLARATRSEPGLGEKAQRVLDLARFQLEQGGRVAPLDLPRAIPTHRQAGAGGERCETALPLHSGEAMALNMRPGESIWFRVQGKPNTGLGVSTRGSKLDTRLSAWPDCRELVADPIASADDSIGLMAELALAPQGQSFWWVRLDNLESAPGTAVLSGVDFSLVQGHVRRATDQAPASNYGVGMFRIVDGQYWLTSSTRTDAEGQYLIGYQENGSYAFRTDGWMHPMRLEDQAWEGVPCAGNSGFWMPACGDGSQQPTPVQLNGNSRTLDFSLVPLNPVRGVVLDAETGRGLANAWVSLRGSSGEWRGDVQTDAAGRYSIGLSDRSPHYLTAQANGFRTQLFDGVNCANEVCDWQRGRAVVNDPSVNLQLADFRLSRRPSIRINARIGGQPAATSDWFTLTLFDESGSFAGSRFFVGAIGEFDNLDPGTYKLMLETSGAYTQLFQGIECSSSCMEELAQGTPVIVREEGTEMQIIDFDLRPRPELSGQLTDTVTSAPIESAQVFLFDERGFVSNSTSTDAAGQYRLTVPTPGRFRLIANSWEHIRQLHQGIDCPRTLDLSQCPGATVLEFDRASADLQIDFALQPNPRLSGRLQSIGPYGVGSATLVVLDAAGNVREQAWVTVDVDGRYETLQIPPSEGALAVQEWNHVPQVFPDIDCPSPQPGAFQGCDLTAASTFQLRSGESYPDLDFTLRPRFVRIVQVLSALDDAPLAGVALDLWSPAGERIDTLLTRDDGRAFLWWRGGDPTLLSTFNTLGLEEQVYEGIRCPQGSAYFGLCSLQGATPISVDMNYAGPDIILRLDTGSALFGHGFEP